jgi:hypothetical protein
MMRFEIPNGITGMDFHASDARVAVGIGEEVRVTPGR